ncbi:MAG TPA: ABC transporter substrate-binding protein [Candidatus Binatia bacterium]|jgi:putative ABC transport system substrate-binding protein
MKKEITRLALCAVLFAFDVSAQVQQPDKTHRVGFLSGAFPGPSHWTTRLRAALRELGFVEGKNITIESRYSENRLDRLPSLAEELVRLKPDVIVAGGRNDTRAARNATRTIPIVGQSLLDPVADGLLDSLARPGGNVTGFTPIADVLVGKRLELLKETVANLSRVALLWNPQDPGSARQWKESQTAARELGLQLRSMEASNPEQLDGAFKEASQTRSAALATTSSAFVNAHQKRIADWAAKNRMPAIYHQGSFVAAGGLMSYGAEETEHYRRVAVMVDKILKGAKPADLPVEQPTKFEFVINLKAAKQIGLTIPPNVLARADRVIR